MLSCERPVRTKVTSSPRMINRRQWLSRHVAQGCRPKLPLSHVLHTTDVAPCIPMTPCATAFPIRHSSGQTSWTAVRGNCIESKIACEGLCNASYMDNTLVVARNDCPGLLGGLVVRSAIGCELSGMQSVGRIQNVFDPLFSRRLPHAA